MLLPGRLGSLWQCLGFVFRIQADTVVHDGVIKLIHFNGAVGKSFWNKNNRRAIKNLLFPFFTQFDGNLRTQLEYVTALKPYENQKLVVRMNQ